MRNSIVTLSFIVFAFSCSKEQDKGTIIDQNEYIEQIDNLNLMDSLSYVFEKETLLTDAIVKQLTSGKEFMISELDLEGKVICYISDIQCSTCIDQELEFIKEFYGEEELVLLGNYSSERDFKLYLKLHSFNLPSYLVQSLPSNLLGRFSNPTYFRVDKGLAPRSVFFASISMPNKSRQFHTIMSSK